MEADAPAASLQGRTLTAHGFGGSLVPGRFVSSIWTRNHRRSGGPDLLHRPERTSVAVMRFRRAIKRLADLAFSLVLIALLAPVLVVLALLVRIRLGSPVLFRQERPGIDSRTFVLRKFRTMRDVVDERGQPLPDAERLDPFGRFLRRTSLDELPELVNIAAGSMSFVGPRPLLVEYLPLYSAEQARRHEVRPGLTGYAQVKGRNSLSWPEKFELDTWYVDNWSLHLDLWILWRTVATVFSGRGVTGEGEATMEPFRGN